jgi:O-antigen ligase
MAKKHKKRVQEAISATANVQADRPIPTSAGLSTWIAALFIVLYLLVEFIPNLGSYDTMGPQWFYLSLVDMVCLTYLLYAHKDYEGVLNKLFSFPFIYILLAFLTWATLSVTWAFNSTETWVCLARLLTIVVAFVNIFLLIYEKENIVTLLAYLLSGILLLQALQSLGILFSQMGTMSFNGIILEMRGNAGNKNIFAASMMIKIPFALYGLIQLPGFRKFFFLTAFTLGTLVIFLLNSRTTYLGLLAAVLLTMVYEIIRFFRDKNREHGVKFLLIILPLGVSYLISQGLVNSSKYSVGDENIEGQYETVGKRMESIVSGKDESRKQRLAFWQAAINYTKSHPLLGAGYGNWKLESIEPSKEIFDELSVPLHAHNDFLEFFAELGLPGGLLYISLFLYIAFIALRLLIGGKDKLKEPIVVMSAIGLLAYAIDAFFNFPIERSVNQIFFSLVSAVCLTSYATAETLSDPTKNIPQKSQGNRTLLLTFSGMLLMLPVAYITFQTYQSLIIQEKTRIDMARENIELTPDYVLSSLPSLPNIGFSTLPLDGIRARYLGQNGRTEEALKYIDRIKYTNPHLKYGEYLKALIYINSGRPDSAQKYAAEAFYHRPRVKNYYDLLIAASVQMKDTNAIKKAFNVFIAKRPELPGTWDRFLEGMTNVKVSYRPSAMSSQMLQLADSALKIFPNDTTLLRRKLIILKNL